MTITNLLTLLLILVFSSCINNNSKVEQKPKPLETIQFIDEDGNVITAYIYKIGDCQYLGYSMRMYSSTLTHKGDCNNPIHKNNK